MQPYFYSVQEFLAMGKHGVYVWTCWGITVAVVVGFILYSRYQRQSLVKQLHNQNVRQNIRQSQRNK